MNSLSERVETIELSLWDIYTFLISGALVATFVAVHLVAHGVLGVSFLVWLEGFPVTLSFAAFLVAFLLLGLMLEPLSNSCHYRLLPLRKLVWKLIYELLLRPLYGESCKWSEKLPSLEEHEKLKTELGEDIVRKYFMDDKLPRRIDTYDWCKDHLIQNGVKTPFMHFLAKFGFYRNAAFLFLVNGVLTILLYQLTSLSLSVGTALIIVSEIFAARSRLFFLHMTRSVLLNFLVWHLASSGSEKLPPHRKKLQT